MMSRSLSCDILALFAVHIGSVVSPAPPPNFMPCVPGSPGLEKCMAFCNTSLSIADRVDDMISRMTLQEKCKQVNDDMGGANSVPSIGWHGYNWNTECLHGLGGSCLSVDGVTRCPTVFPAPPAMGATFNQTVAHDLGVTISDEIRAYSNANGHRRFQKRRIGVSAWGPSLNIYRDPRWGRNAEVPSEDPFHSGDYGVWYTKGLQWGNDTRYIKAIGALKHYTIYSIEKGRGSTYFEIASRDIEETYLPQFRAPVVDAESLGYMCSYAALTNAELIPESGEPEHPHSEPLCASEFFAQRIMRDQYGFHGYVQSDCGAVINEYRLEHWAQNATDAAARALKDGLMNSNCGGGLTNNICNAIAEGLASVTDLEARVRRSLTLLMQAGLFDPVEQQVYSKIPFSTINSEEAQQRSLSAAAQSLVLLQNPLRQTASKRKTLPLSGGDRIALIGPHAKTTKDLAGNYYEDIGVGTCAGPSCVMTVEAALSAAGAGAVHTVEACIDRLCKTANISSAVMAASAADVDAVILALGIDGSIEAEGHDREDIRLPGQQKELAAAVAAVAAGKKPVVLLLFNGGMVDIEELRLLPIAIVECWYTGASGGRAVGETVFGQRNSFGKLPFTYYAYNFTEKSDFTNMNMSDGPGRTYKYLKDPSLALWPFGFGLSYTTFELNWGGEVKEPTIWRLARSRSQDSVVGWTSVIVKNTGNIAGDEVVFLFRSSSSAERMWASSGKSLDFPARELIGYRRVSLAPAQEIRIEFKITARSLSSVDLHGTRRVLPGEHEIVISRGHGEELIHNLLLAIHGVNVPLVLSSLVDLADEPIFV